MCTLFLYSIVLCILPPVQHNTASTEQDIWTHCCRIFQAFLETIFLLQLEVLYHMWNELLWDVFWALQAMRSQTMPNLGCREGMEQVQCSLLPLKWGPVSTCWISTGFSPPMNVICSFILFRVFTFSLRGDFHQFSWISLLTFWSIWIVSCCDMLSKLWEVVLVQMSATISWFSHLTIHSTYAHSVFIIQSQLITSEFS